jgi:hypothetical protein
MNPTLISGGLRNKTAIPQENPNGSAGPVSRLAALAGVAFTPPTSPLFRPECASWLVRHTYEPQARRRGRCTFLLGRAVGGKLREHDAATAKVPLAPQQTYR